MAASFAIHPLFLIPGASKATSSVLFSSGVPYHVPFSVSRLFLFRLPIQLGSTKPPTFRRSSPTRKPAVHSSFVNPIPVWRKDICFILRTLESSQYPFLFSKPFVYKAPCLDHSRTTTAPTSRSSLIHQLLGVTLVVAVAVAVYSSSVLSFKSTNSAEGYSSSFVLAFSILSCLAHLSGVRYLLCLQVMESVYCTAVPQLRDILLHKRHQRILNRTGK